MKTKNHLHSEMTSPVPWKRAAVPPSTPRVVIATDMEGQFMAVYEDGQWVCAQTEESFDSVMTHWRELDPLPDEEEG